MSSKVIEFADFSYLCRLGLYKACSKNCSEEICEEWKLLKAPTLADIAGKRELEDMTEEEFEYIHKKFHVYSNKEIENYFKFVKWFVEHGFNVFGEEK